MVYQLHDSLNQIKHLAGEGIKVYVANYKSVINVVMKIHHEADVAFVRRKQFQGYLRGRGRRGFPLNSEGYIGRGRYSCRGAFRWDFPPFNNRSRPYRSGGSSQCLV